MLVKLVTALAPPLLALEILGRRVYRSICRSNGDTRICALLRLPFEASVHAAVAAGLNRDIQAAEAIMRNAVSQTDLRTFRAIVLFDCDGGNRKAK